MHKNIINNKVYIGQTNNYKKRWRNNGQEYKPKNKNYSRFWNAIQKYGWNNFEHIILKKCSNRDEANYWEIYYIKFFNSQNEEYGYNISEGGNGSTNYFANLTQEEQELLRKKLSERSKRMWNSEEYKQKQSEGMRKVFESQEYKEKMSQVIKKNYENEAYRNKHLRSIRKSIGSPIQCIETGQCFESISAANEFFGKSRRSTAINDFFRGKQKTAFGYTWKHINKEEYYAKQKMEPEGESNNIE